MRTFLIAVFVVIVFTANAQQPVFPATWAGIWKGALESAAVDPSAKGLGQVDVTLEIAPIKGTKNYTWKTTYTGAAGNVVKDYKLIADSLPNHYKIDEGDGIVLNSYYMGGKLYSTFEVEGMLFFSYYEMQGSKLVSEISFGPAKPVNTSGTANQGMGDSPPEVKSYLTSNLQRIVFERHN